MKWPQRIIESLGRDPQVGDWFAQCCTEDLHQIESAEELADLLHESFDDEDMGGGFWVSEAAARAALE